MKNTTPASFVTIHDATAFECLTMLWRGVIYSYLNGTEGYEQLDSENRTDFEEAVRQKILFTVMEELKRRALSQGVPLSAGFLNELLWCHVVIGQSLPKADRDRLALWDRELYPLLARYDPTAMPRVVEKHTEDYREYKLEGRPKGPFLTVEVITQRFQVSGAKISKHVDAPSNRIKHPRNAKQYIYRWEFVKNLADAKLENDS